MGHRARRSGRARGVRPSVGLKTHTNHVGPCDPDGIPDGTCTWAPAQLNATTAKVYDDLGLFTTNEDLGADLPHLFNYLTGYGRADTAELNFDNVGVPHANLLGEEGKGFYQLMWQLQWEQSKSEQLEPLGWPNTRTSWHRVCNGELNRTINQFQVISHLLAEMATEIEAAKQLTYATAYRFARGEVPVNSPSRGISARVSHWGSQKWALQIFGGYGYMMEYPIERIWRDTRLNRIGASLNKI